MMPPPGFARLRLRLLLMLLQLLRLEREREQELVEFPLWAVLHLHSWLCLLRRQVLLPGRFGPRGTGVTKRRSTHVNEELLVQC